MISKISNLFGSTPKRLPILPVQSLYNDFNTDPKTHEEKITDLVRKIKEFNNKYVKVTKTDGNVLDGIVTIKKEDQCHTGFDKNIIFVCTIQVNDQPIEATDIKTIEEIDPPKTTGGKKKKSRKQKNKSRKTKKSHKSKK
jgi:hypothetical protein